MPGDEIRLASLFFGDAPRIRKRTRNAEANTRKPYGVLCRSDYPEYLMESMLGTMSKYLIGKPYIWSLAITEHYQRNLSCHG